MSPRYIWIALAGLLLVGCKSDPAMDLLQSELRVLEDHVYELEDLNKQKQAELESARRENNTLRKNLSKANGSSNYSDSHNDLGSPSLNPPNIDPGNLAPPAIELPAPSDIEIPSANEAAPAAAPNELPLPALPSGPAAYNSSQPEKQGSPDDEVVRIRIDPRLTGGYDFDGKPGDEGLLVVIEPQNEQGLYVPKAGPLSIVVIDAMKKGEEARVARWDFDSIEANRELQKNFLGKGIHIELPWPNKPPEHAHLKLFVRYENLDGKKLEAHRDINVAMPGMISNRWTPSTRVQRRAQLPTLKSISKAPVGSGIKPREVEPSPVPRQPVETARPTWAPIR
jgi:outer membrane murein-binding lipoprotein Lpp